MRKINRAKDTLLTPNQFTLTLKSIMVGIGVMSIPNSVIRVSKQDGWISLIFGAVYPLYLVIVANFLCKKFPKDNILVLSKKCFGNFLGNILNFIFISFFLLSLTGELAGYSNVFRVYAVTFLKNYQVLLTVLIPISFVSYKGIKTLGRLNEVGFYLTICLIIFPIGILAYGSILNLMPIFGSGLGNIVKASKHTVFAYSGMEIIFLIYPFLQDRKKLLKCGLVSTAIVTFIYVWVTFGTIYYLGVDSSQKYLWPVITLADSIKIPVINSFRYIFVTIWSLVQFKCISTYYFAVSYGLNQSIKKISAKTFTILLYPIIIIISMLYGNPTTWSYYV
ncbi:MAG TPA: GerAB/ArcD/ProY family transporter, partial [Clostridium sp.]